MTTPDVPITLPSRQWEVVLTLPPQAVTHLTLTHLGAADAPLHFTYDRAQAVLTLHLVGDATPRVVPLVLGADALLHLQVFLDASVIEVCANDHAWISARIYGETEALPTITWSGAVSPC